MSLGMFATGWVSKILPTAALGLGAGGASNGGAAPSFVFGGSATDAAAPSFGAAAFGSGGSDAALSFGGPTFGGSEKKKREKFCCWTIEPNASIEHLYQYAVPHSGWWWWF